MSLKNSFKEVRYKAIILLCYAFVYYDREKITLIINRPDITSVNSLKNELHAEFINMSLFASDNVINAMKQFIQSTNINTFNDLSIAMRKDLYGINTQLKGDDLLIEF